MNRYFVYIMTNHTDTTLYVGVTGNLPRRVQEHKSGQIDGFTKKYRLHKLVYAEESGSVRDALEREKQLKKWRRDKKEALIRSINPAWKDLSEDMW